MSEPEVYEIWQKQAELMHKYLAPSKYLLSMDEIRAGGSCQACKQRHLSMAQILGDCITKQVSILRGRTRSRGLHLVGHARPEPQRPRQLLPRRGRLHRLVEVRAEGPDHRVLVLREAQGEPRRSSPHTASGRWPGPTTTATRWTTPAAGWRCWTGRPGRSASCTRHGGTSTIYWGRSGIWLLKKRLDDE